MASTGLRDAHELDVASIVISLSLNNLIELISEFVAASFATAAVVRDTGQAILTSGLRIKEKPDRAKASGRSRPGLSFLRSSDGASGSGGSHLVTGLLRPAGNAGHRPGVATVAFAWPC